MEDREIVALYHARDEAAIQKSEEKYGRQCRGIAMNILTLPEDAEECVSDTWHTAWRSMPPQRPAYLGAYLGRITRNLALSRYRALRAQKRCAPAAVLAELEECLGTGESAEETVERRMLTEWINTWLESLDRRERSLFLRRYWYGESLETLAREEGLRPNTLAKKMQRLRRSLRQALEKEGVQL